jgi:uncharacterized protein (TIGR02453 family)
MSKQYFTSDFARFFSTLRNNNTREWMAENKADYIAHVKEPVAAFVDDVLLEVGGWFPHMPQMAKEATFRIYRDVRFSKDKTPHKLYAGAWIAPGGKKSPYPGYYLQLSDQKLLIAGGLYELTTAQVADVREEIDYNLSTFAALLSAPEFKTKFGELKGDALKRVPAQYKETYQRQALIANKQFYYSAELPASLISSPELLPTTIDYLSAGRAINQFFYNALAPTE